MTAGILRPVILLTVAFPRWPAGRRRDELLHELAHVRRHNWLTRLGARIAEALHRFNPLA